jgi:hypothetical protein
MTPTPTDAPPEALMVPDSERKGGCSVMPGSAWESWEIDVTPDEWHAQVSATRKAIDEEKARHAAAMNPLVSKLWKLETSGFYHRSKMRALYGIEY